LLPDQDEKANLPRKNSWWVWTLSGAVGVYLVYAGIYDYRHPQTLEQLKAIETRREASKQAAKEHQEFLTAMCHQQGVCDKFGKARQECATAGNYDRCIDIKLGADDAASVGSCTEDGKMTYTPPDMPNSINCWTREKLK
jgi:hypothetical protein